MGTTLGRGSTFHSRSRTERGLNSTAKTSPDVRSETCDTVVPVEAPRYSTSPLGSGQGVCASLVASAHSLERNGFQCRNSRPIDLRSRSPYVAWPGTLFSVH